MQAAPLIKRRASFRNNRSKVFVKDVPKTCAVNPDSPDPCTIHLKTVSVKRCSPFFQKLPNECHAFQIALT
eukprot:9274815-Karenia_brevis.AAC.1